MKKRMTKKDEGAMDYLMCGKLKWVCEFAGYYSTTANGVAATIERVIYPNDGTYWALVVDGCCDDTFRTLREAKENAAHHSLLR